MPSPVRRRAETPREALPSLRAWEGVVDENVAREVELVEIEGTRKAGGRELVRWSAGPKTAWRRVLEVQCIVRHHRWF